MTVLCSLVDEFPIGTNLGLVHLFWMMLSGQLLKTRGAVIPGLDALGLSEAAVRRGWAALGQGAWSTGELVTCWHDLAGKEQHWQPHVHGGFRPVAVDLTGFPRPRLLNCPTKHYDGKAGKAVPAIRLGLIVRVGQVGRQRLGIPTAIVRAPQTDHRLETHVRVLIREAVARLAADEVAVVDRGFPVSVLQEEGCDRYVVRLAKNFTARRAVLPEYKGKGRRPKYGELVRPLARHRQGRVYPATPPDRSETWQDGDLTLQADWWLDLVLPGTTPDSPTFHVVAIADPRFTEPLLLAVPMELTGAVARALYRDRWPVEQVPLAAKQMIGAHRQFVHVPETCQRLPELALVAGSVLSYLAAVLPAAPTGFWDRKPEPTAGRLRRVLAKVDFSECPVLNPRIREKRSVTTHLPKGFWGQRRKSPAPPLAQIA
jgi:hypothetical protein